VNPVAADNATKDAEKAEELAVYAINMASSFWPNDFKW